MALVNYSSSDESDAEPPKPKISKPPEKKLPLPSAIRSLNKVIYSTPVDDPLKHEGRIRSFEHERGNWSTLVYIPVELSIMDEIFTMVQNLFKDTVDLKLADNIHISLTKTVVLRHHWIKLFVKSLREALVDAAQYVKNFQSFAVYINEDRTRTFLGLVAGEIYFEKLHKLMTKMDDVMNEFRLETFYENPSFHASVIWCVGDFEKVFQKRLPDLNERLLEIRKNNPDEFRVRVDQIQCKSGNKSYEFNLK